MRPVLILHLLLLGACGGDEAPVPEGDFFQYVVSEIRIPENNAQARDFSLDLNDDRTVDNQLGMVFGALNGQGFSISSTARESLLRGNAILLAELQTVAFDDARTSGLVTMLGANPNPPACTDPAMLSTCGQHLATRASYTVVPETVSDLGAAPIERGTILAELGTMPIAIGIDPEIPLRVDLRGARMKLTSISETGASAVIAGGITKADVDAVLIPEVSRNLTRIVGSECGKPVASPCGCPANSRGELLQRYFDDDDNCRISIEEVAENNITRSLFAPDLKGNLLSFGIGVELAPATFDYSRPEM